MSLGLVWFRRDLRLDANPAVSEATRSHDEVVGAYVLDPVLLAAAGRRRRDQLFGYLAALDDRLRERGASLVTVTGPPAQALPALVGRLGADAVHVNADTTPYSTRRDAAVEAAISPVPLSAQWGTLVHPPGTVLTAKGTLSQVFTPFYRRWAGTERPPVHDEGAGEFVDAGPGDPIPTGDSAPMLDPSVEAVDGRVDAFAERVGRYAGDRDRLDRDGTSALSVDLRFGAVSALALLERFETMPGGEPFTRQLAWRDWYAHLLAERPEMPDAALKPAYDAIVWRNDPDEFARWCGARTGFPVVDAAMRQLDETGVVHNRARMIAASFLVKDLLVDWRWGERHYRRLLLDGEVANNVGNWQWTAGTGADAAPYFRIFNPISQSRKFDPTGVYLRRFLPELAGLDDTGIHFPSDVGGLELAAAGVVLGENYPEPIVDHAAARERCLAAYQAAVKG